MRPRDWRTEDPPIRSDPEGSSRNGIFWVVQSLTIKFELYQKKATLKPPLHIPEIFRNKQIIP